MIRQLWAPWRMEFLQSNKASNGCPFCRLPAEKKDDENLILTRSRKGYVIMNRYPYNSGHLLILPLEHIAEFESLSAPVCNDLNILLRESIAAIKQALAPDGFNIGMNLGTSAGAGIPGHLHYHLIPRWVGDTNFMPILNDTKVLNEHLQETYRRLLPHFR